MPEGRLLADSASSQFDDALTGSSHLSRIERLPKWLILIPMVAQWIWLGIRYFSFTLPAATNPAITAGGLVGEGKAEYFGVMGAQPKRRFAQLLLRRRRSYEKPSRGCILGQRFSPERQRG